MTKLLSHHDKWHIHALLGATALVHFIVRFFRLFVLGEATFSPTAVTALLLLVHVLLHCTSFQFFLPRSRLLTKPMIWPEFRVHNAIFAGRNLLGAALGIWFPEWWLHSMRPVPLLLKLGILLATVKLADKATERLGSRELRTTNAMPYPKAVKGHQQNIIKRFYTKSQFAASALAVCGVPALAFGSVLAIEIASFLMTLVRKGIVTGSFYHMVYGLSLFIMGPAMYVTLGCAGPAVAMSTFRAMCISFVATTLRVGRWVQPPWSKCGTWCVALPVGLMGAELAGAVVGAPMSASLGMVYFLLDVSVSLVRPSWMETADGSGARSTSTKTGGVSKNTTDKCDAHSADVCDAYSTGTNPDDAQAPVTEAPAATNEQFTRMLHAG